MTKKIIYSFLIILSIGILIGTIYMCFQFTYGNVQTVKCTIKEKWIKRYNESDTYLVSCDNEVYKISDLFFKGKFDSSNIYARIEVGKKYELTVSGYRFGFISSYQNINDIKLLEYDNK